MSALSVGHAPRGADSKRYLSVALVVSLHLAVLYVFLTAFQIVPNPFKQPGPFITRIITDKVKVEHPFPQTTADNHFIRPIRPDLPQKPNFDISKDEPAGRDNGGGNQTLGPTFPVGPTLPARAIDDTHTIPPYPMLGMRLGHEGIVQLRIVVDEQGRVIAAQVESPSGHPELDDAAIAWVQSHWRYEPAMREGRPVSVTLHVTVKFHLDQARG